jgi:hypothetical protein
MASWRKLFAAKVSRYGESRKSMVLPAESTARYRYVHRPATRMKVSSTRHERFRIPHFRPDPLVQDRSVSEHPPSDGRMIDRQPTLRHHLLKIAVAERIQQLPAYAQDDDLVPK